MLNKQICDIFVAKDLVLALVHNKLASVQKVSH